MDKRPADFESFPQVAGMGDNGGLLKIDHVVVFYRQCFGFS